MAKTAEQLAAEAQRLEAKELIKEALKELVEEEKASRTGGDNGGTKPPKGFFQQLFGD